MKKEHFDPQEIQIMNCNHTFDEGEGSFPGYLRRVAGVHGNASECDVGKEGRVVVYLVKSEEESLQRQQTVWVL